MKMRRRLLVFIISVLLICMTLPMVVAASDVSVANGITDEWLPIPEEMHLFDQKVIYAASYDSRGKMVQIKDITAVGGLDISNLDHSMYHRFFCMHPDTHEPIMGFRQYMTELTVENVPDKLVYSGEEQIPSLTVKNGEMELVPNQDYKITFEDNIDAGTATATITCVGNYIGSTSVQFEIVPKELTLDMVAEIASVIYDGREHHPAVAVTDDHVELLQNTDYVVTMETAKDAGNYDLRITGIGNYTGEVKSTFSIHPINIKLVWSQEEMIYTGVDQTIAAEIENKLPADDVTVVVHNGVQKDAGDYIAEAIRLEGSSAKNYALPAVKTKEYSIQPLEAVLKWSNYENLLLYGRSLQQN